MEVQWRETAGWTACYVGQFEGVCCGCGGEDSDCCGWGCEERFSKSSSPSFFHTL